MVEAVAAVVVKATKMVAAVLVAQEFRVTEIGTTPDGALVLSLRLAQAGWFRSRRSVQPVLLADDVLESGRAHPGRQRRPPGQPLADPVRWEGEAWLDGLLQQARGVVLLPPHLGSFEVAAQAYAERFGDRWPLTALYRPARLPLLARIEATARARPGLLTAPASLAGVRQLLRALKAGQTVGMLPDQVPPAGMGVWAPFFGQPAYTMTLAARLVQQTGSAVAVLCCERLPRGAGYVVRVLPLPEALPARQGDDEDAHQQAAAAVMNRSMEAHHVLKGAGLTVTSYGVGGHVKLPGKSTTPARMMGI